MIIDQYFSKVRLNTKQPGHNLWANKQEVHTPPDYEAPPGCVLAPWEDAPERVLSPGEEEQNAAAPHRLLSGAEAIQPPPGLDQYVRPTSEAMAKPAGSRPTHRLIGKQTPPIVAQLEE
eukprot:3305287-Amphidinium_carterae.2